MNYRIYLVLVTTCCFAWSLHPGSAAQIQPSPPQVVGDSKKICQLTGDADWETGRPVAAHTLSNFGVDGTQLGYPVEHNDAQIFLFGDSWPSPPRDNMVAEVPPDDAVGFSTRRQPPDDDGKCLELQIKDRPGQTKVFAPATIIGPKPIKQGSFNVPTGGVSANGALFGFFWTDHCADPSGLEPLPDTPLARPVANDKCPENDDRNSIGRSVLARSDNDGLTFHDVVPLPGGFVYATAVNSRLRAGLPPDQTGVFVFGVPRYRASAPYLAQAQPESLTDPSTWRFFSGRASNGVPTWISFAEWQRSNVPNASSSTWRPPAGAEILDSGAEGRCVGEFSVTWNSPLQMWLMLYNCAGRILARVATAPWGPWSQASTILKPEDQPDCRVLMNREGCGSRRDFWPNKHVGGRFVGGEFYAPYVLSPYTIPSDMTSTSRAAKIFWLVSTLNPYEVNVMSTTLRVDAP